MSPSLPPAGAAVPLVIVFWTVTAPVAPLTLVTGGAVYPLTSEVLINTAPVRPATD
jgi:hypothetical protein